MAIDFLILALLLVAFVTNLLALAAFWITPGLRTTANRFTINLLIINLIGCLILAPTLFLSNSSTTATKEEEGRSFILNDIKDHDSISFLEKPGNHQMTIKHNDKIIVKEGFIIQNKNDSKEETFYKCNGTVCQERSISESQDTIVITDWLEEEKPEDSSKLLSNTRDSLSLDSLPPVAMRCWSIDMAAALGALAVLLVVGDTWCAVTDPLRYHSRISGVKTWVFIALTWGIGILFGALSAFRVFDFESRKVILNSNYFAFNSTNAVFSMVFACVYFVVIILLPFGFVCGMYWRIFSEARENGLRMRQNGSSPLLQSALNLTHQQNSTPTLQQYSNQACMQRCSISSSGSSHNGDKAGSTGGLHMQIDTRKNSPACLRRDSAAKVLLPTISDDGASDDADSTCDQLVTVPEQTTNLNDGNHNILLTLQTASGEIKRNYSARQLPLLGASSQDFKESSGLQSIRQVHSSPNLHKYTQIRGDSLIVEEQCSANLLLPEQHHLQPNLHHLQKHQHFCSAGHRPQSHPPRLQYSHALQIPNIHASPKSLSYMSSLRHRLSNASSLFKYREESRAARISILVVIMFLVSYLPYGFLVLLQSRLSVANFESSTQLAIFMILLANLSSAFIFAYRNKRVRRGVKRLCRLEARIQERSLKRQSTSSLKGSTLLRQNSANKKPTPAGNVQRNGSKVSSNSCKFLSPQSSLMNNGIRNGEVGLLKPNASCSTIINIQETTSEPQKEFCSQKEKNLMQIPLNSDLEVKKSSLARPKLQRGITIIEQLPSPGQKFKTKSKSFFSLFFKSSKQLKAYSAGNNSVKDNVLPTEV